MSSIVELDNLAFSNTGFNLNVHYINSHYRVRYYLQYDGK